MKYPNSSIFSLYQVKINTTKMTEEEKKFVKTWHYSKSYPANTKITFSLWLGDKLMGVGLFGIPVGSNVNQKYSKTGKPLLELRRLCLVDEAPHNSESWFIGYMLRYIKKNLDIDGVISYADSGQLHFGTIYSASNFQYQGIKQDTNSVYRIKGTSKRFHSRILYQRETKTSKMLFKLKKQGKLITERSTPKHVWLYYF